MYVYDDICRFLKDEISTKESPLSITTDIHRTFNVYGIEAFELIEKFAKVFQVDVSGYLWYFHHKEEEGLNLGSVFFAPPNKRVDHIPITPQVLLDSANSGIWSIKYPEHVLPKRRYDLDINTITLIIFIVIVIFSLITRYL